MCAEKEETKKTVKRTSSKTKLVASEGERLEADLLVRRKEINEVKHTKIHIYIYVERGEESDTHPKLIIGHPRSYVTTLNAPSSLLQHT